MEFLELAKNRYSERNFASKPIEEEKLYKILEAGRIAPTACNYQPQRFYVLKSKEALAKAAGLTYTYNAPDHAFDFANMPLIFRKVRFRP